MIRPGQIEDLKRVSELWHDLYEHEQSHGMILRISDNAVEIWREQMLSRLSQRTNVLLVAESDGDIVGFLSGQMKILGDLFIGGLSAIIQDLYVAPQNRGAGLGRMLTESAVSIFSDFGIDSIEVQVAHRNEVSLAFWTALGWHPEIIQVRRMLSLSNKDTKSTTQGLKTLGFAQKANRTIG